MDSAGGKCRNYCWLVMCGIIDSDLIKLHQAHYGNCIVNKLCVGRTEIEFFMQLCPSFSSSSFTDLSPWEHFLHCCGGVELIF